LAFDQATRNKLQNFVNDARELLSVEFTRQLQQDFGIDPETGEMSEIGQLSHLDDGQLAVANLLRDLQFHYLATMPTKDKSSDKIVSGRIVREQAFSILNRLAALKLMEARGLLIESISSGLNSDGFELYQRLAGNALGETGEAYQCYLLSLFDEFAQDLPLLFDRFSPQALLFPRQPALLTLIDLINDQELADLWAEDETIGWIYQYFNSKDERAAMRSANHAPRDSRELAVRNQFFTPRYVVEFLIDNTLGRLWFDWTGGITSLRNQCQYLLIKPDEQPEPLEILRDPRTIKLLDPACGSMHFGLYSFDLFTRIYQEAWDWEAEQGVGSLDISSNTHGELSPITETYPDQTTFERDIPKLIIEHNIFGVEIDSRATQIATLALWLRAHRAWNDVELKAADRPTINRGNIIAAVAPPGEMDLRQNLMSQMDEHDAELFEKTLFMLHGLPELGVLLRVERELPALVRAAYGEKGELFKKEDAAVWGGAERRLVDALKEFGSEVQSTYQGQLFARDALEGLRLIDLSREKFDVVVMNPPFGALSTGVKDQLTNAYPRSKNDLLAIFVERGLELLLTGGRLGAITSRTCFFLSSFQKWREEIVLGVAMPEVMADLGLGVMDGALVEAAAYVLEKQE
jgi:hypothetical protein